MSRILTAPENDVCQVTRSLFSRSFRVIKVRLHGRSLFMWRRRAYVRLSVALALASMTFFATSGYGQSIATQPGAPDKEVVAPQRPRSNNPEKLVVADGARPVDLEKEVTAVKAENAAVREQLRRVEEQQKTLLELVERLQQRLDGAKAADVSVPVTNTASVP